MKYIYVGRIVYVIGRVGIVINRRNILVRLMSMEVVLLGINRIRVSNSLYMDDIIGQVYGFIVLVIAGGEASLGLSRLVIYYRVHGIIEIEKINRLHG